MYVRTCVRCASGQVLYDRVNVGLVQFEIVCECVCFDIVGNKKRASKSEAGHPFQQLRSRMKALLKPETNLVMALSALRKDLVPRMLPDVAYYKVVSSLGGPPSNTATKTNTVVKVYHMPGRETDFNVRMTEGRNADDKDASGGTSRQKQDGGQGINGGQKGDDGKEDHSDDVISQIDDKEPDNDNWEAMTRQLRRLVSHTLIIMMSCFAPDDNTIGSIYYPYTPIAMAGDDSLSNNNRR